MRCDVHGRIADGIRAASAVGNTVGCFTDGHGRAVLAACSWLEVNGQWQKRLAADRSVGFEDMLVQAAGHLEAGTADAGFDLIMVDEFQDASRPGARLVRGLVQSPGRFLMAVGDDWQSINRFAGADLSVMTDFEALFGRGRRAAVLITDPRRMSPFVIELLNDPHVTVARTGDAPVEIWPGCGQGRLVRRTGRFGPFLGCSAFPACTYTRDGPRRPPGARPATGDRTDLTGLKRLDVRR